MHHTVPQPPALVLNFPANPTAQVVDLDFYGEIVDFAAITTSWCCRDLAYAEIYFDGKPPPSILAGAGARGRRGRVHLAVARPIRWPAGGSASRSATRG